MTSTFARLTLGTALLCVLGTSACQAQQAFATAALERAGAEPINDITLAAARGTQLHENTILLAQNVAMSSVKLWDEILPPVPAPKPQDQAASPANFQSTSLTVASGNSLRVSVGSPAAPMLLRVNFSSRQTNLPAR